MVGTAPTAGRNASFGVEAPTGQLICAVGEGGPLVGVVAGAHHGGDLAGTGEAGAGAFAGAVHRGREAVGDRGDQGRPVRAVEAGRDRRTVFDVPDSEGNAAHFGRPKTHRTERCAYPQVRMVALAGCGTHAITAASLGPLSSSEPALARGLFGHLGTGDLLMADRGFSGLELWRAASAGGADLLWHIRSHQVLPVREELPDGSYLSEIVAAKDHRKRTDPEVVRVIEYTLEGPGYLEQDAPYRLITTILDDEAAPATDLAALYHDPTVLLVEEPTSALDHERGTAIVDLLTSLTHQRATDTVLVTHDRTHLTAVDQVADVQEGHLRLPTRLRRPRQPALLDPAATAVRPCGVRSPPCGRRYSKYGHDRAFPSILGPVFPPVRWLACAESA